MVLSLLELTAAVVGINWRDSVDDQEVAEAQMAGRNVSQRPCVQKALDEIATIVEPWRDAISTLSYFVTVKGETRLACDDSFVQLYMRDAEEVAEINAEQACPLFMWGRMLSPEDQQCFFQSLVQAFYGLGQSSGEVSLVSKCVSSDGSERVCLVRFRVLFSTIGLACALSVTSLPFNKYLVEPQRSEESWSAQAPAFNAPPPSVGAGGFSAARSGNSARISAEKPATGRNGLQLQPPQQMSDPPACMLPRGVPLVPPQGEVRRDANDMALPALHHTAWKQPPPPPPPQAEEDFALCEGDLHNMLMDTLL